MHEGWLFAGTGVCYVWGTVTTGRLVSPEAQCFLVSLRTREGGNVTVARRLLAGGVETVSTDMFGVMCLCIVTDMLLFHTQQSAICISPWESNTWCDHVCDGRPEPSLHEP